MTVKEAILKSLEDLNGLATSMDVYNNIVKNKYCELKGDTPSSTVSGLLGDFIRNGDIRVKRIKKAGETYSYYLTKNEQNIGIDILAGSANTVTAKTNKTKSYDEFCDKYFTNDTEAKNYCKEKLIPIENEEMF